MTNERLVQLKGRAAIEAPLQYGHDYTVEGNFSVTGKREHPNEDGTVDETYILEPTIFRIANDQGRSVSLRKKSTMSRAMRIEIIMWMRDNFPEMDDDDAYEKVMAVLMRKLPGILPMIKKDLEQ